MRILAHKSIFCLKPFTNNKFQTFPNLQTTISNLMKMAECADDNFKFDENGRMFSKRVENTVGKGEIARYEQFLRFPQHFLPFWITFYPFK